MESSTHLVSTVRTLVETVRTADFAQAKSSGLDVDAIEDQLRLVIQELSACQVDEAPNQIGLAEGSKLEPGSAARHPDGVDVDFFPYSPIIGTMNPVAPPMRMWRDGAIIRGAGQLPAQLSGPPSAGHGGVIAAVLDELLGMATVLNGQGGMTARLEIEYRRPTPIATMLDLEARLVAVEGRKVTAAGVIRAEGVVCAAATGLFLRPSKA